MSSTSRNRAYHPIAPDSAAAPSAVSQQSSVININGNPIEAAFEAQIQKRGERFEAELGGRINQIFPRCPAPSAVLQPKVSKTKKNVNTNPAKKRTGKKKPSSDKQSKTEKVPTQNELISSTHQVEIVDNIIDLKTNGSDCDDVNRRNFIHHQQMISSNRESFKTMLSPTTPTDVSTFVPIDNVPKANQNVKRTSQQRVLENEILHDTTRKELSAYSQQIRLEETQKPQQGIQKFSANHTNKLMNPNEIFFASQTKCFNVKIMQTCIHIV